MTLSPAACDSILKFFNATKTSSKNYDLILTGDLGSIGAQLLKELMEKNNSPLTDVYTDCGIEIYDAKTQDVHAGGSGCGCSASVLCGHVLPLVEKGDYHNILFCATGALMSTVSSQQGESIPGVCHIVNIVRE